MTDVNFVKTLKNDIREGWRVWQTLWKHVPTGEYVMVSSSRKYDVGFPDAMVDETMVFASDEHGSWEYSDLAVDYPAKWTKKDHENIAMVGQKNRVEKNAENTEDEL